MRYSELRSDPTWAFRMPGTGTHQVQVPMGVAGGATFAFSRLLTERQTWVSRA